VGRQYQNSRDIEKFEAFMPHSHPMHRGNPVKIVKVDHSAEGRL